MRQFILATGYGTTAGNVTLVTDTANGTHNLKLVRNAADGGDVLFPIFGKHLTWNKAVGEASPAAYKATFTIPTVEKGAEYSAIFIKKGKQFNERSNWSFDVVALANDTATTIATKLVKFVNDNESLGLTASNSAGAVTITAKNVGEDYEIKLGGEIITVKPTVSTKAKPAFLNAEMVKDLAAKCAADAGFEYTEESDGLYPNYPMNIPTGTYNLYTIRFTEPRLMGTREESVYQIIQIAVLSTATMTGLETALKGLQGITESTTNAD